MTKGLLFSSMKAKDTGAKFNFVLRTSHFDCQIQKPREMVSFQKVRKLEKKKG